MDHNKKILILYAPLGAGHGRAAKSIVEAFRLKYPHTEVIAKDILDFSFGVFKVGLPMVYDIMIKWAPFLYKWLYDYSNRRANYTFINRASELIFRKKRFVGFVKNFNPDFIISTNPLPMHLVSYTKEKNIIKIPSANACTDYGFHPMWINQDVNYYFVANEQIKKSMKSHVSSHSIVVTGIPISPKFNAFVDRQGIVENLGLDKSLPIVLAVGGNIKYADLECLAAALTNDSKMQLIIVAGRDVELYKKLQSSGLANNHFVKIMGFVNNMEEYMSVCDLIITKAGGLTIAECMAKELPMVVFNGIPGQEQDNIDYLVKAGAGVQVKDIKEASQKIIFLLGSPKDMKQMKESCRKIAKGDAALKVADFVMTEMQA